MSKSVTLLLDVAEGVNIDDVVTYFNAQVLCKAEEDDKIISSWQWIYLDEDVENDV